MKFSENGLYVERYIKCGTCGALIYEKRDRQLLTHERINYCSQWCIDWKKSRDARRVNPVSVSDHLPSVDFPPTGSPQGIARQKGEKY